MYSQENKIEGSKRCDKSLNGCKQLSKLLRIFDIISSCIDSQYLHILLSADPLLMPIMHLLQIIQRNPFLSLSISLLDALVADGRITLQVNDGLKGTVHHEGVTETAVDVELRRVHVALTAHDLSEDVSICHWGAF